MKCGVGREEGERNLYSIYTVLLHNALRVATGDGGEAWSILVF